MNERDWPLWEVFVRAKGGLSHRHAGSVHAADARCMHKFALPVVCAIIFAL